MEGRDRKSVRRRRWLKRNGRRIIASPRFQTVAAWVISQWIRFIGKSNRWLPGTVDTSCLSEEESPAIIALWHGQHITAPLFRRRPAAALISRSLDAEINAKVLQRFGVRTVRGSGGRSRSGAPAKGGVAALLTMRRLLDEGLDVVMIADIPNGVPRQAGLGIITLARISGRPIVPMAAATSRHYVVQSAWDKTVINLPFGRIYVTRGPSISLDREADETEMEEARRMLTRELNKATVAAYDTVADNPVDGGRP